MELFCDLEVDANAADVVEEFDECDLRAQSVPNAAQLDADHSRPDHHHLLGHFTQRKRPRRRHYLLLVYLHQVIATENTLKFTCRVVYV